MSKLNELLPIAAQVRDATEEYENTANRIGSLFVAIIQGIIDSTPEAAIDASSVQHTITAEGFLITMNRKNSDGSTVPINITVPLVSEEAPGLITPEILTSLQTSVKNALSAAQSAQNSANSISTGLTGVQNSLKSVNQSILTLTDGQESLYDSVSEFNLTILNYNLWKGDSAKVEFKDVVEDLINAGRLNAGMVVAFISNSGWVYKKYTGTNITSEFRNLDNWKDFGGSAVGNIFNVSVEMPITGYYTLCDTINPELSAVHAAWNKGKAVSGLILSFEISAGKWKTYQYIGKAKEITQEAWIFPDNWADFGSLAAGSEKFVIIDSIVPCAAGYYTLESALNALLTYEQQTSIVYRKEGLVITYRSAEREWQSKQFVGSLADFSDASLWKDFGANGGQNTDIEVSDTPQENSKTPFSSGGAYGYLPVGIDVNAETEGVVKLQLRNEKGEAIGDEAQFRVGTGSSSGSATIVAIAFKDSPLYGAFGSSISTKAAIRSVTTSSGIDQDNIIERLEIVDRDSGVMLFNKRLNAQSSADLEDFSFDIDFSEFLASAGARRFRVTAYDDTGASGSKNITVTAVDVTCTCTQTLQYNTANPVTTISDVVSIPLFKFANNQSDKGISAQVDIKVGGQWQPLSTIIVNDTYSHNIQLRPASMGLSHGSYPIRVQGTDIASGTQGNIIYTAVMVLELGNNTPLVSLRYDDRSNGNVKVYETLSLDIACYNPIATQTHINIMLNNEQISQVLALNTRSYTFSQQVKGFSGDSLAYQLVAGDSCSDIVNLLVNGSVIEAELTPGAIYSFDFSSRTNDEPDHTIESNGYAFNVIGSNWRSNGFANFLGENCLRIAENVRATLNHAPFAPSSIEATGAAIQFAFATANIKDKNAHLMECYDENSGAGFYITGNEIAIYCKNGVRSLEKRRFEQSTKINVSIVAEPATIAYERAGIKYSLLSLYLNGEFVATIGYPTGSNNLFNEKNISFYGTKGDFYLYYIEAWNTYFEWAQAFKNSLVKLTDTEVMVREYEFENVLVSQTAEGRTMMRPSAAELYARGIPYVVEVDSEEKFNEFDGGVSTSDNFEIDLYYYHPTMPWRSFIARKVRKRRQGTTYPCW